MCYRLEDPIEPATSATLRRYRAFQKNNTHETTFKNVDNSETC